MKTAIQVALIMAIMLAILFSLQTGISINKYISYVVVSMVAVISLTLFRKDMMQVFVMLLFLVIVHRVFIYRTYLGPVPLEIGILFVIASYFVNIVTMRQKTRIQPSVKLLIAAFFLLSVISSSMAIINGLNIEEEFIAFQVYVLWAIIFMLYGIQVRQLQSYSQITLERIFAIITIGVSFLHMFSLFTGSNIEFVRSDAVVWKTDVTRYFRYSGLFGNVNIQSAFLVGGMTFGMFLYNRKSSLQDTIIGASAFVAGLVSCVMSGSRASFLASMLLVFMFIFYNRKRLNEIMHFIIGVGVASMALAATQASNIVTFFNRSIKRIDAKDSYDQRLELWECTVDLIPDYPLGMGIHYQGYWNNIESCLGGRAANPHNSILDFAVHQGIPGLLIVSICLFFLCRKQLKLLFNGEKDEYASNIFFLTIVLFFGMSEAFIFNLNKLHLIYFFIIGITVGGIDVISSNKNERTLKHYNNLIQ